MTRKNLEFIAAAAGTIIYVASAVADITGPKPETRPSSIPYTYITATLGSLMTLPIIRKANRDYN